MIYSYNTRKTNEMH